MEEHTVFLDEASRRIWEGRVVRVNNTAPKLDETVRTEAPSAEAEEDDERELPADPGPPDPRRDAMVAYIAARVAGEVRGWSNVQVARALRLAKRTLAGWRKSPELFVASAPRRPTEFLERMVCLYAPSPWSPMPAVPLTMWMDRTRRRLQIRAEYHDLVSIAGWLPATVGALVHRHNQVMVVTGSEVELLKVREGLLRAERWRVLEPSAADVATWIGGAT